MDYRIVSIGTLSRHELWNEPAAVRTAHATTILIRSQDRVILVDPGLPAQALAARVHERSGLTLDDITDVFLTNFRPAHRGALPALGHAAWLISQTERDTVGAHLLDQFKNQQDPATGAILEKEIATLKRCQPAPDRLTKQIDLFPLPGYTPGTCGLILKHPNLTTLIAGDAVPTAEHLEQGQVLRGCYDAQSAKESLLEAIEIADVIIPGHDNLLLNPMRRPF